MIDKHPWTPMQNTPVDRRSFLRGAAAVSALGFAAPVLGTGPAKAQVPKRGGLFRQGIAGGSTTDVIDPTQLANTLTININYQVANCLLEMQPDSSVAPELAESFEGSDGGRKWVFKLRRGVSFHNGKEMKAADVVYSLNRHRGPKTTSVSAEEMKIVSDIIATTPDEVTILLAAPNFDLPYLIADLHMTILPEGNDGQGGMGTGAYVLKESDPGTRYLAERNPNYFKSDRGWFDAVETLVINDAAARTAALQTGDVDIVNGVEPRTVSRVQRNDNLVVVSTKGRNFLYFPMRCDKPPFNNPDVRLALKYAIDREEMLNAILFGFGSVGNDHPITRAYPLFEDSIPQRTFDSDKASFHWKKAGVGGPVGIKISDAAFPGAVDAAVLLQASAGKAGIDLQVERVPADGYWEKIWNVEPFCGSQWSGRPTQDLMLSTAFLSTAPWNDSRWQRDDFDKLIIAARSESDTAKRREMYHQAVVMVHEDAGHLNPMFNDYLDGMSKKVQGFVADPNFEMSGYKAAERCWFGE